MPSWRRGPGSLLFFALASVSAAGCGSPPTGTVSGIVKTSDGKPLPKGLITFLSEVGNKDVFNAAIINGKYLTSEIPAGPAKVVVLPAWEPAGGAQVPLEKRSDLAPRGKKLTEVPAKYQNADTSGLHLMVQSGENTFNVDLKP